MTKINPQVMGAVAHALSNDRYPKDGVGYRISKNDEAKIVQTIKDELVSGADENQIKAALALFGRGYQGTDESNLKPWAAKNKAVLDDLAARIPHMKSAIVGTIQGGLGSIDKFQEELVKFTHAVGLSPTEEVDTHVEKCYKPELIGADSEIFANAFCTNRVTDEHASGEFVHVKGPAAIDKFLEGVEFIDWDLHWYNLEPEDMTADKFRELISDPIVKDVHFVGSWASEEEDGWGVAGNASWNLILEMDAGHFLKFTADGGWQ